MHSNGLERLYFRIIFYYEYKQKLSYDKLNIISLLALLFSHLLLMSLTKKLYIFSEFST